MAWRAEASGRRAAGLARPTRYPITVLLPSDQVRTLTDAYRNEWAALGRDAASLPPLGVSRQIVVADTADKAREIAERAFVPFADNLTYLWRKFDLPMTTSGLSVPDFGSAPADHRYAGDPAGARAWVAEQAARAGVDYFALEFGFGDMTAAEVLRSAELFATEVIAAFS